MALRYPWVRVDRIHLLILPGSTENWEKKPMYSELILGRQWMFMSSLYGNYKHWGDTKCDVDCISDSFLTDRWKTALRLCPENAAKSQRFLRITGKVCWVSQRIVRIPNLYDRNFHMRDRIKWNLYFGKLWPVLLPGICFRRKINELLVRNQFTQRSVFRTHEAQSQWLFLRTIGLISSCERGSSPCVTDLQGIATTEAPHRALTDAKYESFDDTKIRPNPNE